MQYTINQLYDHLCQRVNNIYDIFKEFFGEEFVDLQNPKEDIIKADIACLVSSYRTIPSADEYELSDSKIKEIETLLSDRKVIIYVWWPTVTVTNENDKSINIQDLYAKIEITLEGRIPYENTGFLLNRATYTRKQFLSDYLHSHIQDIPKQNFTRFGSPCLGSGPIRDTIATLKNEYNDTFWLLFCQELSMYVTVESLAGGPWKRLESVGGINKLTEYNGYKLEDANTATFDSYFDRTQLKEFIRYYLQYGHLSLSYMFGKFVCGMPYYEFIIDISNAFIDYYNEDLSEPGDQLSKCYARGLLNKVILVNNSFYKEGNSHTDADSLDLYRNKFVLNFKGKDIYTSIIDGKDDEDNITATVINHYVAMYVLNNILRTINFRYKNEHNNTERGGETSPTTSQRVVYL